MSDLAFDGPTSGPSEEQSSGGEATPVRDFLAILPDLSDIVLPKPPRGNQTVVMTKYPRVPCPSCERPVAGVPTRRIGVVSVVDHKPEPRSLTLCPGSMQHVPVTGAPYLQEAIFEEQAEPKPITIF